MKIKDFKNFSDIILVGEGRYASRSVGYDPYWEEIFWNPLKRLTNSDFSLTYDFYEIHHIFGGDDLFDWT